MTITLPVKKAERSDILDAMRGLAILGIFLNNIFGFSGYSFLNDAGRKNISTYSLDGILYFLQAVFVEGKFYSLFSLLFGIGFSIIMVRNEEKGINPLKIFYRRIIVLLIIGFLHLRLIWDGDILFLYGLIGLLLPLFRNCSDRSLLIWAFALIISPILIDAFRLLVHGGPGDFFGLTAMAVDKKNGLPADDSYAYYLYKEGSGFSEWSKWKQSGIYWRYEYILNSNRIPKVLGMFLLGFYAGRKSMFSKLEENEYLFRKLRFWGFVIGIPANIAMVLFELDGKSIPQNAAGLLDTLFYALGVVPLCLAYTSSIGLSWIKRKGNVLLKYCAPVGRMALTNYIVQTFVGIIIFYRIGFGLGTKIGPTYFLPIAFAVYFLQVLLSTIWFRYFQYGPLEWIWRQLTYGKRLSILK